MTKQRITDSHFPHLPIISETGLISEENITINGGLNVDLNNLVTSHSNTTQTIWDELVFENYVNVMGKVSFGGLISGFNLTQFCILSSNAVENAKSIVVNGNFLALNHNIL